MRVTGAVPRSSAPQPDRGTIPCRIPSLGLTLTPSEGKALVELLDSDAIVPLRKVMAAIVDLQDVDLDDSAASRERVDMARGARRVLLRLDEVLCQELPDAYGGMVKAIEAREETDGNANGARKRGEPVDEDGGAPGPE